MGLNPFVVVLAVANQVCHLLIAHQPSRSATAQDARHEPHIVGRAVVSVAFCVVHATMLVEAIALQPERSDGAPFYREVQRHGAAVRAV